MIRRRMVKELLQGTLNPTEGKDIFDVAREVGVRQKKQIQRVKSEEKKTDEKNMQVRRKVEFREVQNRANAE